MPEIQMPKLSDTMTEGTLVAWKKKKGDEVSAGEVLAEIETDKATMEWESPEDGTLTEIYVEEGGKVNVGDKIGFIAGEGEEEAEKKEEEKESAEEKEEKESEEAEAKEKEPKKELEKKEEKPKAEKKEEKKAAPPREKPVEAGVSPAPTQPTSASGGPPQREEPRVKASPVARRIAAELGVDLSAVKGTGPEGRITETDVRSTAKTVAAGVDRGGIKPETKAATAVAPGESARIQLSGMRKSI